MFASQLREAIREVTESQPLSNYGDNSGAGAAYLLLAVHVPAGNGLSPGTSWAASGNDYCRFNSIITVASQTFIRRD